MRYEKDLRTRLKRKGLDVGLSLELKQHRHLEHANVKWLVLFSLTATSTVPQTGASTQVGLKGT